MKNRVRPDSSPPFFHQSFAPHFGSSRSKTTFDCRVYGEQEAIDLKCGSQVINQIYGHMGVIVLCKNNFLCPGFISFAGGLEELSLSLFYKSLNCLKEYGIYRRLQRGGGGCVGWEGCGSD